MSAVERAAVLDSAKAAVLKDRNRDYAPPEKNFRHIADLWNAYVGSETFTPTDVAVLMVLTKIARASTSPALMDHWVDIAGYAACGYEVAAIASESKDAAS